MNLADRECGIGRGLCSITSNNIGTAYLWWSLHHYRCDLFRVATGSTYEAVSAEEVRDLNLLVPPFEEQESIASFLNHETKRIDELIHEKERMLELLAEKRAALVTQAVTRGLDSKVRLKPSGLDWLGEIPAHWREYRLKFVIDGIDQGFSPQCSTSPAEEGAWGVLKTGCVNGGVFNEEGITCRD
jgi:type I restriction enzyme S subunit